jgi:hypothetical protein
MRGSFLLVLAAMLFGCAHTPANSEASDTYFHQSGLFSFPSSLASLTRTRITPYDAQANDVGITYKDPNSRLVISIYAYPAPKLSDGSASSLSEHFSAEDAEVLKDTAGTVQVAWPSSLPVWSDEGVPGVLQAYNFGGDGSTTSLLQLYDYGKWRLKFRSTYLTGSAERAEVLINQVHKAFKWPSSQQLQTVPPAS